MKLTDIVLKLFPFTIACMVSINTCKKYYQERYEHVLIKVLPIVLLVIFIFKIKLLEITRNKYAIHVMISLVVSIVGDALLVYQKYFVLGMISFTYAHFSYSNAFGWTPLKLKYALIPYTIASLTGLFYYIMIDDLILKCAVPVYSIVIYTMVWRALTRLLVSAKGGAYKSALCSFVGSMLFIVSDSLLGWKKFIVDYNYSSFLIMSTYYLAQLFMALSVITVEEEKKKKKKNA